MYSTHNEGKPVVAEKFRRVNSIKRMTAIGRKYYFGFLNKLVDECNNTYNNSIGGTQFMLIILLCLKKLNWVTNLLNLKLVIKSELLGIRMFLANVTPKAG